MDKITNKGGNSMNKVYSVIVEYTLNNLYPPSISEIKEMTGIKSTSSIQTNLTRLEQNGKIKIDKGNRRIKLIGYKLVPND